MRGASVFGEAIIAIVYLPILALTGIEGKLFRPMATTVLLSLAGAFVLSLTLVPVLTSYFVKPSGEHRETWLLRKAQRLYAPLLGASMRFRTTTLGAGALALALRRCSSPTSARSSSRSSTKATCSSRLAACRGSRLSESVATDRRMQHAILEVPEVTQVVSKTGAPELATDPMGIEQTDVYIGLKEREAWRRA